MPVAVLLTSMTQRLHLTTQAPCALTYFNELLLRMRFLAMASSWVAVSGSPCFL
jgi:hypothetical protein